MKTVQIRHLPDEVHRTLRARAAQAGLSLSDFLLAELERVAARPTLVDTLARARGRAGGSTAEAVVAAVRTGRDREFLDS